MLARELGFLQGFRLSGRDPEAQSATPGCASSFSTLRRSLGLKTKDRRTLVAKVIGLLPASIGIEARRPRCLRRGMHMMRIASLARPVALVALGVCLGLPPAAAEEPSAKDVLKTYADIAAAGYAELSRHGEERCSSPSTSFSPTRPIRTCSPPAPPGSPRASPTCRPRPTASATRSSTIGRAR